ncbi:MAG: repair protein SbcC/Rad50 [Actinomycetota bacterium]|jgi:exonuclease SbcC|nr:repair protein SbcC/Rad50 [Actinomycetota bacterium]
MRLHSLEITGFGPFAGSERVDLDALASSGLFLIHGPTGAGKSSILDAICFALYAAVPGTRAGARASLRSDHALEGIIPEVTLELTAGGRRMRVRRSPEFSRRKKRGTGETTVPAKVVLEERLVSGWEVRGTRHDEVGLVLKDVLGMGVEQFTKVVLLPQGDFAVFLRASPEERRSVLEKLFDTQRFTDIESWLVERRRCTADTVRDARAQLSTGLVRVNDVMARLEPGDDIMAASWSDLHHDDVGAELAGLVSAVDLRAVAALADVESATATLVQTETGVHRGTAVLSHQKTAADARDRLRALDDQHEVYQDALKIVGVAQRANAVSGFISAVASADKLCTLAKADVVDLRGPLTHILAPHTTSDLDYTADVDMDTTQSVVDQMAGHSDALEQCLASSSRARTLAAESAAHTRAAQQYDAAALALAAKRVRAEQDRAAAEVARDEGRVAAARLPGLEARHKSLTRLQKLLVDQQRSTSDLEILQRKADTADRLSLDARGRLLDLRERRLAGMAAELANGIPPDGRCPVCGSCEHPDLAKTTDPVSPDDIHSAEADQTLAAEALGLVRSRFAAELASKEARALEISADQPSLVPSEVPDALLASAAAIATARPAAASLPGAQEQLESTAQDLEALRGLCEQALSANAASLALAASTLAQSELAEAEVISLLDSHNQSCPCHINEDDHPGHGHAQAGMTQAGMTQAEMTQAQMTQAQMTQAVGSRHRQALAGLRSFAIGLRELVTHETNAREAGVRLSKALHDNGFTSAQQAAEGVLSAARVAELTALLRAQEQQRAQANALLAQLDVIEALGRPIPDVAALAEAHSQAAASLTDAGRRHTLSEQAQRDLRALSKTVHHALADLGPAQEEARVVQELADCVTGNSTDNALRMRLSSYVLAARLDEIATLANERLGTMSDGRYTLEYTDARAARGARSGLGLMVRDAWTGQRRETSSLSGGEAFMASLALALGLGDAVRAEAGGFDLQTLFVDEGFGSLDEESLEQVMAVLDTLREGGRAVGIVSHVSELRTRIPHQLCVLKQQAGSSIRTDVPATAVA